MAHTWSRIRNTVNDFTHLLYYRGQLIKEAYYRGKKIWRQLFLGIFVGKLPDKLHYDNSSAVDYSGVNILGKWTSRYKNDVTAKCSFYPPEATFINPSDVLLGIVVSRVPDKREYVANEILYYSGVSVKAVYADGHTVDITSQCAFSPLTGAVVKPFSIIGILVTEPPLKTVYDVGDPIDFTGVKVLAIYSNGRMDDITSECSFSPANKSVIGGDN